MPVNVTEMLTEFIRNLMTDRGFASQYAEDPQGMLAAQGVTDHDLSNADLQGAVRAACADPSVSQHTRSAVQSGGGPSSSGGGHSSGLDSVVQHLNYVTYATYEGDTSITNLIDNSVDVTGTVFGDVDVNNATGDGAQIIDGDNLGQANTGDGAVLAGGDATGVNTGVNTGINAGGDVDDSVVGDHNQTANVDGSADGSTLHFGDGATTNVNDSTLDHSAVGGDNIVDNTLEDGSAISTGSGDVETTSVEHNDSSVTDSHDTVTAIQDNDTDSHDVTVVDAHEEDNDTVTAGGDAVAAQ